MCFVVVINNEIHCLEFKNNLEPYLDKNNFKGSIKASKLSICGK